MIEELSPELLVARAVRGDEAALETLISGVQHTIYNLALRMLWHPADAEDATQEILIKIVTHLSQFRGQSAFRTWVFRIATNHLLTTRERVAEIASRTATPEATPGGDPDAVFARIAARGETPEDRLLRTETQTHCALGMLLCLDRELRIAFILGVVFNVSGEEGGAITGTAPAAFRKRLSRSRERLHDFMAQKCSLVDPAVTCVCSRRVGFAAQVTALFGGAPTLPLAASAQIATQRAEVGELQRLAHLFRSHPTYAAPADFTRTLRELLHSGAFTLFEP